MSNTISAVQQHYESVEGGGDVLSQVQTVLSHLPEGLLQLEQLSGMDQFHVRGLPATVELADSAGLSGSSVVLDAGSGFGGSSRYLAKRFGCKVTGVDLTPSYIAISDLLTERTGLTHLVKFQAGDLTQLSFPANTFDLVWTQHVVINISQRDTVYSELFRVIRPGGSCSFMTSSRLTAGQRYISLCRGRTTLQQASCSREKTQNSAFSDPASQSQCGTT